MTTLTKKLGMQKAIAGCLLLMTSCCFRSADAFALKASVANEKFGIGFRSPRSRAGRSRGSSSSPVVLSVSSSLSQPEQIDGSTGASSASSSSPSSQCPTRGSIVTVDCRLRPVGDFVPEPLFDGIVFGDESNPQRISFVLGQGNYLPGLHDLVASTPIGAKATDVCLDAGWGQWNPQLQATMSLESLGNSIEASRIKVGVELMMSSGVSAIVTKVTDSDFTIDANPPLAGASYMADIEVIRAEDGPADLVYKPTANADSKYQVATVAGGCFWGVELEFMREPGVVGTKVGYTQGHAVEPTYQEVCTGATGHSEAMMITFDPAIVSYDRLLHIMLDRLGEDKYLLNQVKQDKGTQYRHGVYYHNDEQRSIAERIVGSYGDDCKTEVLPATVMYNAEEYHQQYLLKGGQSARKGDQTPIRCYG